MVDDLAYLTRLELCNTKADRALWLLTTPHAVLSRLETVVRHRLAATGFGDGLPALSAHVAAFNAPRLADGDLPATVVAALEFQKSRMREIVRIGGRS